MRSDRFYHLRAYLGRRVLLIIPTILGIMILNFIIVQAAPGGPIEYFISRLSASTPEGEAFEQIDLQTPVTALETKGARGLDPKFIHELEVLYGFDKPAWERLLLMIKNYMTFDLGESYFRGRPVWDLILEKLPVSISLGLWSTLLLYLIGIPLGVLKAIRDGSRLDFHTTLLLVITYAIPSFMIGLLFIIFFSGGSFWAIFPLRGLVSDNWHTLDLLHKILDYLWHLVLPVGAMVIGSLASITFLTKNSFLDEIAKTYVLTARAKGVGESRVLWDHIFRNAMLVLLAGVPHALVHILFTSAILMEVIFSLDGLGLLGFEAALSRDYPIMFGTLYVYTLVGLFANIFGDILYAFFDQRISFEKVRD